MGEKLGGYLWDVFSELGESLVNSLPGLLTIVIIAILARTAVLLLRMFFDSVARHKIELTWVDPYTAPITRRLLTTAVYVFAVAMAYPNIPRQRQRGVQGSDRPVRGDGSPVHQRHRQAVSGLILIYRARSSPANSVRVENIHAL
jgi:hypothetical protein